MAPVLILEIPAAEVIAGGSIHVYGADISRLGSSVRRVYELPVLTAAAN